MKTEFCAWVNSTEPPLSEKVIGFWLELCEEGIKIRVQLQREYAHPEAPEWARLVVCSSRTLSDIRKGTGMYPVAYLACMAQQALRREIENAGWLSGPATATAIYKDTQDS